MNLKTQTTCTQYDVSAKAVICHGDRVLLLRRANGRWDLPGGRARPGEHVTSALRREVREETGLVLRSVRPLLVHKRTTKSGRSCQAVSFHCQVHAPLQDTSIVLSDEHVDFAFFSFEQIALLRLRLRHKRAITQVWHLLTQSCAA